jgi:hypothetical protein
MKQSPKRGPGRPPKEDEPMVQLAIRFPKRMIDAIDEIRAGRLDSPDRAVVIREMVAKGLGKGPRA